MSSTHTFIAALSLSTVCATAFAQAELSATESPTANTSEATLDQVLVTGEQAGPGLWKVSKGDHVLWIFGTYGPLPKKVTWRSKEVELTIAESQELLMPVNVKPNIGFFKGLTLLPSMIGLRNNPNKATLKEVVPAGLYERWFIQKEKHTPRDSGVEKFRPSFAAGHVYEKAVEQSGLEYSDDASKKIEKIAKKHKLKITTPTLPVEIDKPREWIKEFKKSSIEDMACFTKTIELLETDMDQMRVRANAWAVGNIAPLRSKAPVDQQAACVAALMSALSLEGAQERGFQNIPTKMVATWIAATETALAKNSSTFAVLPINDIYWTDGYVEKLRAKGYAVEEP